MVILFNRELNHINHHVSASNWVGDWGKMGEHFLGQFWNSLASVWIEVRDISNNGLG